MAFGSKTTDLAVIQVNYERTTDTIECIHSLRKSDYQNIRIILVDNGSKDDSVDILERAFPELPILLIGKNIMFTGGHNAGIHAALDSGATHIFILNNDTILDSDAVTRLMQAVEQDGWDVAVPKIVYYDNPSLIWSAGCRYRRFPPGVLMTGLLKPDAHSLRGEKFSKPSAVLIMILVATTKITSSSIVSIAPASKPAMCLRRGSCTRSRAR